MGYILSFTLNIESLCLMCCSVKTSYSKVLQILSKHRKFVKVIRNIQSSLLMNSFAGFQSLVITQQDPKMANRSLQANYKTRSNLQKSSEFKLHMTKYPPRSRTVSNIRRFNNASHKTKILLQYPTIKETVLNSV